MPCDLTHNWYTTFAVHCLKTHMEYIVGVQTPVLLMKTTSVAAHCGCAFTPWVCIHSYSVVKASSRRPPPHTHTHTHTLTTRQKVACLWLWSSHSPIRLIYTTTGTLVIHFSLFVGGGGGGVQLHLLIKSSISSSLQQRQQDRLVLSWIVCLELCGSRQRVVLL